ncbi:TPA: MerC domain-containing protein [Candidatus Latescibacteria bacterium]|nr:MerC domain-containing protein [Candidatus Latescibacterota bacterium]
MSESLTRNTADQFAILGSTLCLVHCIILPGALVLFPSLFALGLTDEHYHAALLKLVVPLSLLALFMGYRRHRKFAVPLWGLAGLSILALPVVAGHDVLGESLERIFTIVGSVGIVVAHIRNQSLCRASE